MTFGIGVVLAMGRMNWTRVQARAPQPTIQPRLTTDCGGLRPD